MINLNLNTPCTLLYAGSYVLLCVLQCKAQQRSERRSLQQSQDIEVDTLWWKCSDYCPEIRFFERSLIFDADEIDSTTTKKIPETLAIYSLTIDIGGKSLLRKSYNILLNKFGSFSGMQNCNDFLWSSIGQKQIQTRTKSN